MQATTLHVFELCYIKQKIETKEIYHQRKDPNVVFNKA